nr:AAA family ATPase [Sphingomonas leidyi]
MRVPDPRIAISGCSGGGKSTLLDALARRGFATMAEPGRRIVAAGGPMPWDDPAGFARRAIALALADLDAAARLPGPVFFDRGLIDAVVAFEHATGEAAPVDPANRYDRVFLAPPWPEIHVVDDARRHGMDEALAEYARLEAAWPGFGYAVERLPKIDVEARADFVLARLEG